MDQFRSIEDSLNDSEMPLDGLIMGTVLANNDPHQMGRVRVLMHGIDEQGLEIEKYRWVHSFQSLMGVQLDAALGPNKDKTEGFTSYGKTGTHKIGTVVGILFFGGHISNPIIIGAMPPNDMITGLPGGNRAKNEIDETTASDILPTKTNMDTAFGSADSDVKDTRGFEVTYRAPGSRAGAPDVEFDNIKDGDPEGDRAKFGYPKALETTAEGFDIEPMMYSFTSPGQHTVLMNDDPDNCRVRVRTVSGNQVILDDTNERIYISTAEGNNYIEMDVDGHIDIYSSNRISIHGEQDINIKSDKQVNIEGTEGINLKSTKDIKISTDASTNVKSGATTYVSSGSDTNINSNGDNKFSSGGDSSIKSGGNIGLDAGSDVGITASGTLAGKGSKVDLNGGPPASATKADDAIAANAVNREPLHEKDDWRSIDPKGKRSDAATAGHNDQAEDDTYDNKKEGGLASRKRLASWRK